MREIKFRVWDKDRKTLIRDQDIDQIMFKRGIVNWYGDDGIQHPNGEVEHIQTQETSENIEVMQYTGLKDKNGVAIYEGDVVLDVQDVVVENIGGYDRTEPEGIFMEVKIPDFFIHVWYEVEVETLEVIGNIYANPELI
jgi:uncharacterized phage protein (TIGR01671 family)